METECQRTTITNSSQEYDALDISRMFKMRQAFVKLTGY
jgi:hypothetical protein